MAEGRGPRAYVVQVVRVGVLVVHGAVWQRGVAAVGVVGGVHAPGAVEQRQAVGHLVVQVVAALGQHGAAVAVAVEAAGPGQRGVLQHVTVHLRRLVQIARGVILCEEGTSHISFKHPVPQV